MEPEEMSLPTCYRSVVEATQRMKVVSQISRYVPTWIHRLMRPIALHLAPTKAEIYVCRCHQGNSLHGVDSNVLRLTKRLQSPSPIRYSLQATSTV